jgi:hypothetical protein
MRTPYLFTTCLALSAAISMTTLPALAQTQDALEVHTQGDVRFISGGIGDAEMESLAAAKKDYNLYLMSANSAGEYTGDIHVLIRDAKNATVLETDGGPYIYVDLPTGSYTLEARYGEQTKQHRVTLASGKPARVDFRWK